MFLPSFNVELSALQETSNKIQNFISKINKISQFLKIHLSIFNVELSVLQETSKKDTKLNF